MKNLTIAIISICAVLISACATKANKSNGANAQNIPFIEAKGYFVKNNVEGSALTNPKITTKEDFDRFFGMATVMGKDGKPTNIDFSNQYVIAVIAEKAQKQTFLQTVSLLQQGKNIVLTYKETQGQLQSFTTQPKLLLVLDKKYDGDVTVQKAQ